MGTDAQSLLVIAALLGLLVALGTAPGCGVPGENSHWKAAEDPPVVDPPLTMPPMKRTATRRPIATSTSTSTSTSKSPSTPIAVSKAAGRQGHRSGAPAESGYRVLGHMELQHIPGGSFQPGSSAALVTVPSLYVGIYEVTQRQFALFVAATGHALAETFCWARPDYQGRLDKEADWLFPQAGPDHPVVCINQADARAFARWMSDRTGHRFRLPTAAEWEWAARSGPRANRFAWGDHWPPPLDAANLAAMESWHFRYTAQELAARLVGPFEPVRHFDDFLYSAPVGEFAANDFGLHDLSGNVWEWVGDSCAVRGGSWDNTGLDLAVTSRRHLPCDARFSALGFRLVMEAQ